MGIQEDDYKRLVRPIEDQMIRSVWKIVRDPNDAQDAFQEALLKIWTQWKKVCRHPNPHALILRICINCAYDQLRQKESARKEDIDSVEYTLRDAAALPSERLIASEERAAVFAAIGALPRMQRVSVHMHFVDGLSYTQIAQAFGCAESTIRKHVYRARQKLQETIVDHTNPF
jgi:RNA polymerase sigma-70 factor (ECF subfamily)